MRPFLTICSFQIIAITALCVGVSVQSFAQSTQKNVVQPVKVWTGLNFPEGPAYDGRGSVVVSNCYGGYIARFDEKGRMDTAYKASAAGSLLQKTNGTTYFRDGSLFVCDFGRKAIIRIAPSGEQTIYAETCDGKTFLGPNDLAFDPQSNLYFTDPTGSSENNLIGCVYRVEAGTRAVKRLAEGLAFPNGIAFSADAKTLFVAESRKFHILRFVVKPDGTLGEKTVFATMPTEHDPDGMAFDAAGNLWVAQYGSGNVRVFSPDGKLLRSIPVPAGKNVTNLEFAGADLKTLYITEAETGTLYKMSVETAGQPLHSSPRR